MGSAFDGTSLRSYRESLSSFGPLDRTTEQNLARKWRDGDQKAGGRIIEACLPFVVAIALEYRRWGVPMEDIIQQGNLGLLRAARKFDPSMDCRLATYAAYWIRAEIRDYVVRTFRVVRLGTTKSERKALRAYRTTRETDPERLSEVSGLDVEKVRKLLPLLLGRESSLDAHSADAPSLLDRLEGNLLSPEEEASSNEERDQASEVVRHALQSLSLRERFIVRERMMKDEPLTLQALGDLLGVSKERVRQLEERAKLKLRDHLESLNASG